MFKMNTSANGFDRLSFYIIYLCSTRILYIMVLLLKKLIIALVVFFFFFFAFVVKIVLFGVWFFLIPGFLYIHTHSQAFAFVCVCICGLGAFANMYGCPVIISFFLSLFPSQLNVSQINFNIVCECICLCQRVGTWCSVLHVCVCVCVCEQSKVLFNVGLNVFMKLFILS